MQGLGGGGEDVWRKRKGELQTETPLWLPRARLPRPTSLKRKASLFCCCCVAGSGWRLGSREHEWVDGGHRDAWTKSRGGDRGTAGGGLSALQMPGSEGRMQQWDPRSRGSVSTPHGLQPLTSTPSLVFTELLAAKKTHTCE